MGSFWKDTYVISLNSLYQTTYTNPLWLPLPREVVVEKKIDQTYNFYCSCGGISDMDGPCRHLFCVADSQNGNNLYNNIILASVGETWRKRSHEDVVVPHAFPIQHNINTGHAYSESSRIKMPKLKCKPHGNPRKSNSQSYNFEGSWFLSC